jgi:multicomponent Na+:H+ antiporter subunit F
VLQVVTLVALGGLFAAAALCMARLVRGGSIADRIVALDTLLLITVSAIAVLAVRTDSTVYLPVLVVAALIAFIGTITVARFIDERGAR